MPETSLARRHQVALITGAASGLGRELARQLAAEGIAIAAIDRQAEPLLSLESELKAAGHRIGRAVADVTNAAELRARTQELEASLGPVDMVFPFAGVGIETSALNLTAEEVANVININLIGVSNTVAAVLGGMLARKKGHIVAVSSLSSFRGLPRMLGYCAAKSGLNAFMEGLRVEVGSYGIDTTIVCPGWVRTPMTAPITAPMAYLMDVDKAVSRIIWAVEKRKWFYAFPRRLAWRLRFLTLLPRSWQDAMIRRMLRVK